MGVNDGGGFTQFNVSEGELGSELLSLLSQGSIVPGSPPGYQLCKVIYSYHPLGLMLAEAPITRAQSKPRIIRVQVPGEESIVEQYERVWGTISKVGATEVINNVHKTGRIYGIATIAVGERGKDPSTPLDLGRLDVANIYINVLDPLNTAGSLVLNQDPNAVDFLKPRGVFVNGQAYHTSRTFTFMNEQPLYIDWVASAFGFVGRSVYQRALYPLKSFVQSMITDQMVVQKAGLLVYNGSTPGPFVDLLSQKFAGIKRSALKSGVTNQVAQIGMEEKLETLNMQNLDGAFGMARTDILKNIATACGMPASIIAQETLQAGFGEGEEDSKREVAYLDFIRTQMGPTYAFMDRIVQRLAWTPDFYKTIQENHSFYADMEYEEALTKWINAFTPVLPNLLDEPDSEKSKNEDVKQKAAIAHAEVLLPIVDPQNKATIVMWLAENINEAQNLFASKLVLDEALLREHFEETKDQEAEAADAEVNPKQPKPFGAAA